MNKHLGPPYFDPIFEGLGKQDAITQAAFGRHVHWGYWHDPLNANGCHNEFGAATEELCRMICDAAAVTDNKSVLDVGCGFGGTIASLNERFTGLQMVGLNIDPRQLELAAKTVRPRQQNSIQWLEADASAIPCSEASFDVVLAVESIFHFDREKFFAEAKRILKECGSFAISDFLMCENAGRFLHGCDVFNQQEIQKSYGNVDLTWSLKKYHELATINGLVLKNTNDITANTMPTYDFLLGDDDSNGMPAYRHNSAFLKVTRTLQKACRRGIMSYQILTFCHA